MTSPDRSIPDPRALSAAPVRHRLRVELDAAVPDVWALVGRHERMPEYSGGIAAVALDAGVGAPRTRVCQFRAPDGSPTGPRLRETILWEAPELGYAASAEPGNPFGLSDTLSLVTVRPRANGTLLEWEERYDADDLPMARASFDEGLADIAQRLVARFGGQTIERWTDAPSGAR